jgi:class 3 adenylate cyclase/pimeloyl-ACP methyl ester carboxylesterase
MIGRVTGTIETQFAWNGDVALAYQVVGDGPVDLLYVQGYASHVALNWEGPALGRFLRRLAAHSRLIVMDRRGWGCSDRFSPFDVAPLETLTDDLLCVLDAVGSERPVVMGTMDCSVVASLFAATHPRRTRGLILCDAMAAYDDRIVIDGGYSDADWEAYIDAVRADWGRPAWVAGWMDRREADWFTRLAISSIAPGGLAAEMVRNRFTDPRAIYPTIHLPSLVLAPTGGDPLHLAQNGAYLAATIPGARLVQHEWSVRPWLYWYERGPAIVSEVGRFLARIGDEDAMLRRVLATVLFTDIVGATERAARLGDASWRELVERHHATVRGIIARYGGTEVDTAGDGFFATFDGPGRGIRAAEAVVAAVQTIGLEVRAGLHTGECELVDGKPAGLIVNIGARVAAIAQPSEVLVSDTVRNLVAGAGISFVDRGVHQLKGVPDEWHLWAVGGP